MLEQAAIIAFITIAVWATMLYEMIFGWVRDKTEHWPIWLKKPVYECPICMTAWYGTLAYWLIWGNSVKEWGIVVICGMGIVTVFVNIKNTDT